MPTIESFIPEEEIAPLRKALHDKACFTGLLIGSVVSHDDGDLTIDFNYGEYAGGDMIEDEEVVEELNLVLSEDYCQVMYALAEKYPDIVDADLIINF